MLRVKNFRRSLSSKGIGLSKTNEVFSSEFKGFEFTLDGDKKFVYALEIEQN
jgi:hypothetical protein